MKLTKHTDYAFRVLIYLAGLERSKLATIKEVTIAFDISRDHVMKIVQKLAKAGYIEAIRGKFGGMKLGKSANEINLREIISLMEVTLLPVNCKEPICRIEQGCQLKEILFQAQEQFLSYVEQYSLADLVKKDSDTLYIIQSLQPAAGQDSS